MEKVEKDGKVAVLYSPGFGSGWGSCAKNGESENVCMDARIVSAFIDHGWEKAVEVATDLFPNFFCGGANQLKIFWVEKGKQFEIEEYDGNESVHVIGEKKYMTA